MEMSKVTNPALAPSSILRSEQNMDETFDKFLTYIDEYAGEHEPNAIRYIIICTSPLQTVWERCSSPSPTGIWMSMGISEDLLVCQSTMACTWPCLGSTEGFTGSWPIPVLLAAESFLRVTISTESRHISRSVKGIPTHDGMLLHIGRSYDCYFVS